MQPCFCCQPRRDTSYICPRCWSTYSARALREMRYAIEIVEQSIPPSLCHQPHWQKMTLHRELHLQVVSLQHHPLEN